MLQNIDYSELTIDELKVKENDTKNRQKGYVALAIIAVGFTIFSIYEKNTGFIHTILPLISILLLSTNGTNLKKIQTEIIKKATL